MKSRSTCMRADGFTLIEILVALAVLTLIAGLALFATGTLMTGSGVAGERDALVNLLSRARNLAMMNAGAAAHGVCLEQANGRFVLFAAPYVPDAVEAFTPADKAIIAVGVPDCGSGGEIIFEQISGDATAADITLTEGTESARIRVNEVGGIEW
jgi:prepilin-type N-terminal cleavage/methylation domain-containing protein